VSTQTKGYPSKDVREACILAREEIADRLSDRIVALSQASIVTQGKEEGRTASLEELRDNLNAIYETSYRSLADVANLEMVITAQHHAEKSLESCKNNVQLDPSVADLLIQFID
jgi:hypothetical protein